jgi:hypothetical protein
MTERFEPQSNAASQAAPRRRSRARWVGLVLVAIVLAGAAMAAGAVYTNAFGAGDRFASLLHRIDLIVDPPPDRPTAPTILATPRPIARATPEPTPSPRPAATPPGPGYGVDPIPTPSPSPTPTPKKKPVTVRVVKKPKQVFITQLTKEWCAPAGVQMVLASLGLADNTEAFQHKLVNRSRDWESRRDSLNGGWGPGAMVQALDAYGAKGYEVRAFKRRQEALLDAARALSETRAPVILIAWRGAHTWVMTGYKATADPMQFEDAKITGTYILDPWYPRVSTIWGPSDPAGTFQDEAEMRRNYLPWKRPEGRYPYRDGRWLIVAPTIPASEMG